MNLWHLHTCSLAGEFWVYLTTFIVSLRERILMLDPRRLMHINKTLDRFWKRWRQEYLLELRESHRYHRSDTNPSQVSVGDIVIVHSDDQLRGFWRLGRVKEVLIGRDAKIRGAVLRVAGERRWAKLLQRPLQLIYPLDICVLSGESEQSESVLKNSEQSTNTTDDTQNPSHCPPKVEWVQPQCPPPCRAGRAAAIEAQDRLMAQALSQTENDNLWTHWPASWSRSVSVLLTVELLVVT